MDLNVYVIEQMVKERLGEAQAAVIRARLVESLRARPPLRVVLGQALVALGRRLEGRRPSTADVLAS